MHEQTKQGGLRSRRLVNTTLAVGIGTIGIATWLFVDAQRDKAEVIRTYGYNVDSGYVQEFIAVVLLFPCGLLLFAASLALWRQWRRAWVMQYLAVAWPLVVIVALGIGTIMTAPSLRR